MTQTRSPTVNQETLTEQIRDALDQALEADTQRMKNYHIRSALQYCVIQTDRQY